MGSWWEVGRAEPCWGSGRSTGTYSTVQCKLTWMREYRGAGAGSHERGLRRTRGSSSGRAWERDTEWEASSRCRADFRRGRRFQTTALWCAYQYSSAPRLDDPLPCERAHQAKPSPSTHPKCRHGPPRSALLRSPLTMDQNAVKPSPAAPTDKRVANESHSGPRIAHTLTACVRCRTVCLQLEPPTTLTQC